MFLTSSPVLPARANRRINIMDKADINRKVRWVIEDTLYVSLKDGPDDIQLSDLGIDSLDAVDIAMRLDDEFQIEINDDDIQIDWTVNKLVDYIAGRLEEAGA
jgi:acyl carrier protein